MGNGKVYVVHNNWIQNPDAKNGCKTYKIGITTESVSKRYYGLGLKMPSEFVCDFAYEFNNQQYIVVEKTLHNILNRLNVGGEWYDLNNDTLVGIHDVCTQNGGKLITNAIGKVIAGYNTNKPITRNKRIGKKSKHNNIVWTREMWIKKSKWMVETADSLKKLMSKEKVFEGPDLRYKKEFIAVASTIKDNFHVYFYLNKGVGTSSKMWFFLRDEKRDELITFLRKKKIPYDEPSRKGTLRILSIDKQFVEHNKEVFIKIAEFVKDRKG